MVWGGGASERLEMRKGLGEDEGESTREAGDTSILPASGQLSRPLSPEYKGPVIQGRVEGA